MYSLFKHIKNNVGYKSLSLPPPTLHSYTLLSPTGKMEAVKTCT